MPKKKKKGAEKEKKGRKSKHINEKDTLTFEQEIIDNNKQIARLRSRNQELETEIEVSRAKLQQLEEDRADIIAHLKRNLQNKTEEAQELNERLYALEELRNEEMVVYKQKEEERDHEYQIMENNLTTEIQLAAGKLSALEEWRAAKDDLMHKFEVQEQQIQEQEERHKKKIYEVEKHLITSKANLQREMQERLKELSDGFRGTVNHRIADTTKRTIHENIFMNKELDIMFKVCREINIKLQQYEEQDYTLKLQASVCKSETRIALKKVNKQNEVIQKLLAEYCDMVVKNRCMKVYEFEAKKNENLAREYEDKYRKSQERITILEQEIEIARENTKKILKNIGDNNRDIIKLKEVIRRAKECIKSALKLPIKSREDGLLEKKKFLTTMLDILGSDLYFKTANQFFKEKEENMKYVEDNLGLLCSHTPIKIKTPKSTCEDQELEDKSEILDEDNTDLKLASSSLEIESSDSTFFEDKSGNAEKEIEK